MPISKYFTYAGSALLVLLFVSNAYLTDGESDLRFDGSLYESALYAPRVEDPHRLREPLHPGRDARRSGQGSVWRVRSQ